MNILSLSSITRPLFLSLFLLFSPLLNSMQTLNGLSVEELKNVNHTLGALAFGTLVGPNKILTSKSFGEIQWVVFNNPGKVYQVDHSVKHDVYDIQLLILKEDVDKNIAIPIELAAENITHEFLREQNIQLSFVGSAVGYSQMPSDVLNLSLERGLGALSLMSDSINRILVDENNLGLQILSTSTFGQDAQFKYDSYDEGGAVLYKEDEAYKLIGMVIKNPALPETIEGYQPNDTFYFQDIQSIRNWINNTPHNVQDEVTTEWILPEGEKGFRLHKKDELRLKAIGQFGTLIDPQVILTDKNTPKINSVIFNNKKYNVKSHVQIPNNRIALIFLDEPVIGVNPIKRFRSITALAEGEEEKKEYKEAFGFKDVLKVKYLEDLNDQNELNFDLTPKLLTTRCAEDGSLYTDNYDEWMSEGAGTFIKVYVSQNKFEYQVYGLQYKKLDFVILTDEDNNKIDMLLLKHSLGIELPKREDDNYSDDSDSESIETESEDDTDTDTDTDDDDTDTDTDTDDDDTDTDTDEDDTDEDDGIRRPLQSEEDKFELEIKEKVSNLLPTVIQDTGIAPPELNPKFVVLDKNIIFTEKLYDYLQIQNSLYKTSVLRLPEGNSLLKLHKNIPLSVIKRSRNASNDVKSKELYLLSSNENNQPIFLNFKLSAEQSVQIKKDGVPIIFIKPNIRINITPISQSKEPALIYIKNLDNTYEFVGFGLFDEGVLGIIPFPIIWNDSVDKYLLLNALDNWEENEPDFAESNIDKLEKVNLKIDAQNNEGILNLSSNTLAYSPVKFIDLKTFLIHTNYLDNDEILIDNEHKRNVINSLEIKDNLKIGFLDKVLTEISPVKRARSKSFTELDNKVYFALKDNIGGLSVASFHMNEIKVKEDESNVFMNIISDKNFHFDFNEVFIKDDLGELALVGYIQDYQSLNILTDNAGESKIFIVTFKWYTEEMNSTIDKLTLEETLGQLLSPEERYQKDREKEYKQLQEEQEQEQKKWEEAEQIKEQKRK